jgi:hypothetical protein
MTNIEKFTRNILNELTFTAGSDEFIVHPAIGSKAQLIKGLARIENAEKRIEFIENIIFELIYADNKDVPEDLVKRFVSDNLNVLMDQLMVGFKIVDKKDLEDKKKELAQLQ